MDRSLIKLNDLEEDKEIKQVSLKLITGGKEPPTTTGNWLKDLEDGSVFFVQNKVDLRDFNLVLFRLEGKAGVNDKVVCLRSPNLPKEFYVDPHRFCNMYNLHHTEGVMALQDVKEDDQQDNREPPSTGEKKETVE